MKPIRLSLLSMTKRVGILLILMGMLMLSGCGVDSSDLAGASSAVGPGQTMTQDLVVFGDGGNAICSPPTIVSFRYIVTAPSPGLSAVLAVDKTAYDTLLSADLSNPSTAKLPASILDMSCTGPDITTCQKTFPVNQNIAAQGICILLRNDGDNDIRAHIETTWYNMP